MTPNLREAIKVKHKLYRNFKRVRTEADWACFKTQRNRVSALLRTAKSDYVAKIQHEHPDNCTNLVAGTVNDVAERTDTPRLHKLLGVLLKQ